MMTVRRAKLMDTDAIWQLNKEVMEYDYPLEQTRDKLQNALADSGQCVLVAVLENVVVGYIHLVDYDTLYFPHMKNVLALAVLPEYRRRGAASSLLAAGEQWARETGAAGMRLDSGVERTGAHACYAKAGFVERKLHKNLRKLF